MGLHCSKKVTCVIKRINIRTLQQFLLFELLSLFPNKKLKSHKKVCAKKDFCNILMSSETIKKAQLYGPILWMGFNCLKARATWRMQFIFYHWVCRNPWYSFYRPWKDERLSRPWSHPVVLNTGSLDWESSTLTTRPLLRIILDYIKLH